MSTPTIGGYDAAWPVAHPPTSALVVFGYLGGDTPHPWSLADWLSQPARYRVGIWTRSNPQQQAAARGMTSAQLGTEEGRTAASMWQALGATPGSLMGLDLETAIDPDYVSAFDAQVVAYQFKVAAYGSKSSIFQNPRPSGGYWVADLTGQPHLYPGSTVTQYQFESNWDDDTIAAGVVLWDTRPPTAPASGRVRRNDMHLDLVLGDPERVFTNPAAALGGSSTLLIAGDFGDSTVRLAKFLFGGGWVVEEHVITAGGGALSLPLPSEVNKVGLTVTKGDQSWPVGVDVLA